MLMSLYFAPMRCFWEHALLHKGKQAPHTCRSQIEAPSHMTTVHADLNDAGAYHAVPMHSSALWLLVTSYPTALGDHAALQSYTPPCVLMHVESDSNMNCCDIIFRCSGSTYTDTRISITS